MQAIVGAEFGVEGAGQDLPLADEDRAAVVEGLDDPGPLGLL